MTVAQRIYLHHLPHTQRSFIMKQIDFEHGKITDNILRASIPMLVAEVLSLLYNIVDRIYIARIPWEPQRLELSGCVFRSLRLFLLSVTSSVPAVRRFFRSSVEEKIRKSLR